jgi:HPt (histidine-containing phosphotransfer) domain-containing protein
MTALLAADIPASQQGAIDRFFKGSATLYHAFREASMAQFPHDIAAIETAMQSGDAPALRRHAHNLKSALDMLGFETEKQQALTMELAACAGDLPAAARVWHSFQQDLTRLIGLDLSTRPTPGDPNGAH